MTRLSTASQSGHTATYGNEPALGYTADALNQYAAVSHPGIAQVLGYSPEPGTITVTPGQIGSTTVQDKFWRAEIGVENDPTGIWAEVEAKQVVSGTPARIGQGKLWIPPATANLVYDDEGRLKQDGRWDYHWDAESRLVGMTTSAAAISGGHPWKRLSFQYDFIGRRIQKKVETGSPASPVVSVNRLFLYDGWNLLAEVEKASGTAKLAATYLWGLDVSGTAQGAGGAGGLLLTRQDTNGDGTLDAEFRPTYDGTGNIIAWIGESGAVVSRIDYDPFGRVLTRQGHVNGLAHGFATKYQDEETGLVYFGLRYYSPETGRWISREPLGEMESFNLYAYCHNDPVNKVDVLGAAEWRPTGAKKIENGLPMVEYAITEQTFLQWLWTGGAKVVKREWRNATVYQRNQGWAFHYDNGWKVGPEPALKQQMASVGEQMKGGPEFCEKLLIASWSSVAAAPALVYAGPTLLTLGTEEGQILACVATANAVRSFLAKESVRFVSACGLSLVGGEMAKHPQETWEFIQQTTAEGYSTGAAYPLMVAGRAPGALTNATRNSFRWWWPWSRSGQWRIVPGCYSFGFQVERIGADAVRRVTWPKNIPSKPISSAEWDRLGCNCVDDAKILQSAIGGQFLRVSPPPGPPGVQLQLGRVSFPAGGAQHWYEHAAVIREGKVYDRMTGIDGMPLEEYKQLFQFGDVLKFNLVDNIDDMF